MLSKANGGSDVLEIMKEVLLGTNIIVNKFVNARCQARRMSGEMNTSLGNCFSNLMFMGYVCEQLGLEEPNGVVEGDDGLFQFLGKSPDTDDFTKYGFLIKLSKLEYISQASFCGNLFDEQSRQIVTDPFDVLCSFGWTTARYRHSTQRKLKTLLRAKALSFAHQYPGCPIIGALAQYALRMTRGRTNNDMLNFVEYSKDINMWYREQLIDAINFRESDESLYVEPAIGTRLLFEELYKIPISIQIKFEEYLNDLSGICNIESELLLDLMPESWKHYYEHYVLEFDRVPEQVSLDRSKFNDFEIHDLMKSRTPL
jgi:hypothetical protein